LQLFAACSILECFLGRFPSFGTSCNFSPCANADAVAHVGKGRVEKSTPAFAPSGLPSVPDLPDHTFYMVTPGGAKGAAYSDALQDIKTIASWFCVALSVSEKGAQHSHWLVLIPTAQIQWLDHHPQIFRDRYKKRPLPQVFYDRDGTVEPCDLVFSLKNRPDIALNYLTGPRNRAKFRYPHGCSFRVADMEPNNINNLDPVLFMLSDGLGWSRGGVTPCKPKSLHSGGAERLQAMTGREVIFTTLKPETTKDQQLFRLLVFHNSTSSTQKGDPPVAAMYCSGFI